MKFYTVSEVAAMIGKSKSTVVNRSALLSSPAMRLGKQGERVFTLEQAQEIGRMKAELQGTTK